CEPMLVGRRGYGHCAPNARENTRNSSGQGCGCRASNCIIFKHLKNGQGHLVGFNTLKKPRFSAN
ncbi:MAG: hypothetical protein VW405_10700, partial [Rhodospirillaceae bacterium]